MYRLRGVGSTADFPADLFGGFVDCRKTFSYWIDPRCWKYSQAAWEQMAQFGEPSASAIAPPPAVPEAYGHVAAPYDCAANPAGDPSCPGYDAAVAAALKAGKAQTDTNILDFFKSQPNVAPECAGAYQDDSGNWQCPEKKGINWLLWGGIAVGGVLLVSLVGRR
jgi:hypothetical protein